MSALWHAQRLQARANLLEAALFACIHWTLVAFAVTQADDQRNLIRSSHLAERCHHDSGGTEQGIIPSPL